jgi:putative membrane protein insertion efficiency factor
MNEQGRVRMVAHYLAGGPGLLARGLIKVYRYGFSALTGFNCRHLPTCSDYAEEAIGRFGLWAGGWMTLARLCRCHPLARHQLRPRDCAAARLRLWRFVLPASTPRCAPYAHRIIVFRRVGARHRRRPDRRQSNTVRPRLPAVVGSE